MQRTLIIKLLATVRQEHCSPVRTGCFFGWSSTQTGTIATLLTALAANERCTFVANLRHREFCARVIRTEFGALVSKVLCRWSCIML